MRKKIKNNIIQTDLISSLRTPMRLSWAAKTPFWILTLLRERKLFKGHPASKTIKPANALRPSNLHKSNHIFNFKKKIGMKVMTDWYKKRPPIIISKKAGKKSMSTMLMNFWTNN